MGLFSQPGKRATGRFGTFEKEAAAKRRGLVAMGVEEEFTVPEFDSGRIAGLTQEQQAPQLSALRRELQKIRSRRFSSPTARSESIRAGVRGFGEALPAIQAGAVRTATGLAQSEFNQRLARFDRMQRQLDKEEERAEATAFRRGRRDPSSTTYREAQADLDRRIGLSPEETRRFFAPTTPAFTRFGPTAAERSKIEDAAIEELQALSGGYNPSVSYGG